MEVYAAAPQGVHRRVSFALHAAREKAIMQGRYEGADAGGVRDRWKVWLIGSLVQVYFDCSGARANPHLNEVTRC